MVEIADIKDRESLQEWLEGQPQRFSVVIAHRAAMRVLPVYWHWSLKSELALKENWAMAPILWASLTSGSVSVCPSHEIISDLKLAASVAYTAVNSHISNKAKGTRFADTGTFAAIGTSASATGTAAVTAAASEGNLAAVAAANAATQTADSAYAATVVAGPDYAQTVGVKALHSYAGVYDYNGVAAQAAIWSLIRSDCSFLVKGPWVGQAALWMEESNPLQVEWEEIKAALNQEPVDWQFWVKWYEAALSGTPLPWALLERVALEVKEEDWAQGPQHVNGMIAEIEAEFVADALPQADKMDVDPDTGLVEVTPILTTEEAIVATSLKQVEFSYSVAKNSNCGLNFNSVACLYLEQTFENCRDDPNAILQNYQIALDDILDGLKNGAYLDDAKLTALSAVLEKEIVNLLANHPEVKKADRARIAHALSLAKSDVKLKIVEELEFAKAAVGLRLDAEMSLDSKLVAEEAESPAQAKAAQRLFGRIAQMYVTMKTASVAVVKRIDAATGYKFARIVMTLGKIVGWITSLFT